MKCEIRNVQSSETYDIPPEGQVFGRQGGPANITIADQSVSKRHARVFFQNGSWLLEDLKSVNGTVVSGKRITDPVQLAPGTVFSLSKHQFEVVAVEPSQNGRASRGPQGAGGAEDARGTKSSQRGPSNPQPKRPPPADEPSLEPILPPEPSRQTGRPFDPEEEDLGGQGGGVDFGQVMAALPKAIGYYLANVPLMALNPKGTVDRGVEEQKVKPMRGMELTAFAIPVLGFQFALGAIAGMLAGIIGGAGFSAITGGIIGLVIGAAIGIVSAIITGLFGHPIIAFIFERIFKGETNDKTRTNYLVMAFTASALLAVPGALTTLLTAIILKLSTITAWFALLLAIPGVVQLLTTWLMPYIIWQWSKVWQCASWAQTLFKVLTILAVIGGVAGLGSSVWGGIQMARGGGVPAVPAVDGDSTKVPTDGTDPKVDDGKVGKPDEPKPDGDDGKVDDGKKPDEPKPDTPKPDKPDTPKPDTPKPDTPKPDTPKPDTVKPDTAVVPDVPTTAGSSKYADYKRKRDYVEKTIADNPHLLVDDARIGNLYKELSRGTVAGIDQANDEINKKERNELRYFLERYREARVYDKTKDTVDQLYKLLTKK